MSESFNAYHKWLGIPSSEQPANLYRLLGIPLFESDTDVIAGAADRQMAHVRSFQSGPNSAISQKILNEIAAARVCLLNAKKKAEYDTRLRAEQAAAAKPLPQAVAIEEFDLGIDLSSDRSATAAHHAPRKQTKGNSWHLPVAIGAGLLVCAGIAVYLATSKPAQKLAQNEQPRATAPADSGEAQLTADKVNNGAAAGETAATAKSSEGAMAKPPDVSAAINADSNPEPKGPTAPAELPPAADLPDKPEKLVERIQAGLAAAKSTAEFRKVAAEAISLVTKTSQGDQKDVTRSAAVVAINAARKAKDEDLIKAATLCVLDPGNVPETATGLIEGQASTTYLDDLPESELSLGHGTLGKHGQGPDPNGDLHCIVRGAIPAHSLIPHPPEGGASWVKYHVNGRDACRFRATVTISDQKRVFSPMVFRARGDDRLLWESKPLTGHDQQQCDVSLKGVDSLTLEVYCEGNNGSAWTVWVDPRIVQVGDAPAPARLAVPETAAQEQALKLARELYKELAAPSLPRERQQALSRELLEKAIASDDAAEQFILFRESARMAVAAKDAAAALEAIAGLAKRFEIDAFAYMRSAITAIGKNFRPLIDGNAPIGDLLALMEEAMSREEFDAVKPLAQSALELARKFKDPAVVRDTTARAKAIQKDLPELQKASQEVQATLATLDKDPIDAAANAAAGKYYCFLANQWDKGLPMLALGDDADLKELAIQELKGGQDSAGQDRLADAWWGKGEKCGPLARSRIRAHAANWYRQALPDLVGLAAEMARKRLNDSLATGLGNKIPETGAEPRTVAQTMPAGGKNGPSGKVLPPAKLLATFNARLADRIPEKWRKAGLFAAIDSNGTLEYDRLLLTSYVIEMELAFGDGKGLLEIIAGESSSAACACFGALWPQDEPTAERAVMCRLFRHQPFGVTWSGEKTFDAGRVLTLKVAVNEAQAALLQDGKSILGIGVAPTHLRLTIKASHMGKATIRSFRVREFTPADAAALKWNVPKFLVKPDPAAVNRLRKQLADQKLKCPRQPEPGRPLLVKSILSTMRWIAPGQVTLGSANGNQSRQAVRITRGYWIGHYETTQEEWAKVMKSNPSRFQGSNYLPVHWIRWDEAMEFCKRLTVAESAAGRLPRGYEYRLPTEAEWEFACRAGTTEDYAVPPGGFWRPGPNGSGPTLIGQTAPNAWGLYDMQGNVAEWCLDKWDDLRDDAELSDRFLPGNPQGRDEFLVRGGGWWAHGDHDASSVFRWRCPPVAMNDNGMRLVLGPILTSK